MATPEPGPVDGAPGYFLYILRCADGSYYTGISTDVGRRMLEHESGVRGARYLRGRSPFELVFQVEAGDRSSASRLEWQVKQLSRVQKERLVAGTLSLESMGQVPVSSG